jgi:hypothetical protein
LAWTDAAPLQPSLDCRGGCTTADRRLLGRYPALPAAPRHLLPTNAGSSPVPPPGIVVSSAVPSVESELAGATAEGLSATRQWRQGAGGSLPPGSPSRGNVGGALDSTEGQVSFESFITTRRDGLVRIEKAGQHVLTVKQSRWGLLAAGYAAEDLYEAWRWWSSPEGCSSQFWTQVQGVLTADHWIAT